MLSAGQMPKGVGRYLYTFIATFSTTGNYYLLLLLLSYYNKLEVGCIDYGIGLVCR
jgi:hypothetical protein